MTPPRENDDRDRQRQNRFEEFEGFPELIKTLRQLVPRTTTTAIESDAAEEFQQWLGWRLRDRTPPIIGLVQPRLRDNPGLINSIADRLSSRAVGKYVPHVVVHLPHDTNTRPTADTECPPISQDDVRSVRDVLIQIANGLERESGGAYRLPRFRLLLWLMSQQIPGDVSAVVSGSPSCRTGCIDERSVVPPARVRRSPTACRTGCAYSGWY